jgi:methionine-rich copper-binding protein CopC
MRYVKSIASVALVLAAILVPGTVFAHAHYDHSDPAAGVNLNNAPTQVKVWFTEGVKPAGSSLMVLDASGLPVSKSDSAVDASDAKLMTVSLNASVPNGVYTVKWKTISADDGDDADGQFQFSVGGKLGATLTAPATGLQLMTFDVKLGWTLPAAATQYQLQVVPFNNDGPGVDLIRASESSFAVPAPPNWYGLLPGMSYTWQVRFSDKASFADEKDTSWGPWSEMRTFFTPTATSSGMKAVSPANGASVSGAGPATLTWSHPNPVIFYYEVQVSTDKNFITTAGQSVAPIWWNLVHGGVSKPANSWTTPALQAGKTYYWRVRPRVQGNGAAVEWSDTWSFKTP